MAEFAIDTAWNQSIDNTLFMLNYDQNPDTPEVVALRSGNPAVNMLTDLLANGANS
jgi:hypothetical protein